MDLDRENTEMLKRSIKRGTNDRAKNSDAEDPEAGFANEHEC